jgi:hypothetical protein
MQRVGFHVRGMEEFERVISLEGVNLIELKPEKFKKRDGIDLYTFDGERFTINETVVPFLQRKCEEKGVIAQIHLPFEKKHDPTVEHGLCQGDIKHHDLLLARYDMFGEMLDKYGIGTVLTTHPPANGFRGKILWSVEELLEVGRELYAKLDKLILEKGYKFKVGLENMVAPKKTGTACIGYLPEHIDKLLGNTSEIGITIDSGHRRLNDDMSIAKLISYGKIVNCHFHSNSAERSEEGYDDDEHVFATKGNFPHYPRYIKGFKRRKYPVILEIGNMAELSDEELVRYVRKLRKRIDKKDF